jgi:hypothetical protein
VVFFQWEIDNRDGNSLLLKAEGIAHATVTYGPWNDRSKDITHRHVPLPFILDPSKDGFSTQDQEYYVIAVRFEQKPMTSTYVIAEISDLQGHAGNPSATTPFYVDDRIWNGNASVISYSSGILSGYGLDRDEGVISSQSTKNPSFYAQWEVDTRDGARLEIAGPQGTGTVRYGLWDDRTQDVIYPDVSFPFVIEASGGDGSYYVISVELSKAPQEDEIITFIPVQ